jgi:hypothetical protein
VVLLVVAAVVDVLAGVVDPVTTISPTFRPDVICTLTLSVRPVVTLLICGFPFTSTTTVPRFWDELALPVEVEALVPLWYVVALPWVAMALPWVAMALPWRLCRLAPLPLARDAR